MICPCCGAPLPDAILINADTVLDVYDVEIENTENGGVQAVRFIKVEVETKAVVPLRELLTVSAAGQPE